MKWNSWIGMTVTTLHLLFWSMSAGAAPAEASPAPPATVTSSQSASSTAGGAQNTLDKVYTFSQINGLDGFSLRGSSATREFYLPILREWALDSVTLHVILLRAALFSKSTTLTVYANNHPIDSIELSGQGINKTWDLTLPASLVKNGLISVMFSSVVNEAGFSCYNLINPSYWIYVSGDSTVTYHYKNNNYFPDLSKLPYPFIHDPSLTEDHVLMILPDDPGLKIMAASFNLANMLGNKATWRGVIIDALTLSQVQNHKTTDMPIIMIGTGKALKLNSVAANWPLPIDQDGTILDKNKQKIADNVGVIMLSPSPYDPKSALLTVTGNTDEGVNRAALMLRDPNFANSVLYNSQALVLTRPDLVTEKPHWQDITLKMLGFNNETVYGGAGSSLLDYDIDLPVDKKVKRLRLSVHYLVSNFLKNVDPPYLTIRVNGTPLGGTPLVVKDENIKTWDFDMDGSNFLPGKNRITFDFNIRMQRQDCNPQITSLSWVTLFSNTELHVDMADQENFLSFPQFTASTRNLAVAIPASEPFFHSAEFIQKLLDFGKLMQEIGYVDFYDANASIDKNSQNSDILYIGNINHDQWASHYAKNIPFYFKNNGLYVSPALLPVLNISSETPYAITELLSSPLNPKNLILFITAQNPKGYLSGMDVLTNQKKNGLIIGNVVLSYENDTFNSIQSQKLALLAENKKRTAHALVVFYYVLSGLVIFSVGIILLIILRRKIKYYFSKNHDNE